MKAGFAGIVSLLTALFGSAPTRAAEPEKPRAAFAVVIGNNHSLLGNRPDLHYADDDAARYFDIFRGITRGRAQLLTNLDRDSARLFPAALSVARPPTRAALQEAGRQIADGVRQANGAGRETELYFVFAGHGDVDAGEGYIELADGRLEARELEAWLRAIPFTRAHVILDSCNSFFMLGVRKPGGRYFATPADAARSLATRLPNVGVFLSTSAEGETFEWSEIQSGIFSHVVRSGLLGAADANADGAVSYLELSAFVATATADVKNPNLRPHAYARGPANRDDAPLVALRGQSGARRLSLADGSPLRVRLRDRESLPLLDAHAEAGHTVGLSVPEGWLGDAKLERWSSEGGSKPTSQTYALREAGDDAVELTLPESGPVASSRGPGDIFHKLFARPFGPRAVAEYRARASSEPERVFGVSREDAARMNLLLWEISSAERGQRIVTGTYMLSAGALFGALAYSQFAFDRRLSGVDKRGADLAGGFYLGLGVLATGFGAYAFGRPWEGERIYAGYRTTLATQSDYALAFADADRRLQELADAEARRRVVGSVAGGLAIITGAGLVVGTELSDASPNQRLDMRLLGGGAMLLGVTALTASLVLESPIERLTKVWRHEPTRPSWAPIVSAMPGGGALFGATGQF
ncbi:MAG: hypothetical protein QM756_40010 [Polyangiaceae bacterium]